MKMVSNIFASIALVMSAGTIASAEVPADDLAKIKKTRDANEYFAKRHKYYDRVDLSFSKFPIDTELPDIKDKLDELSCGEYEDDCTAKDAEGNQLYFWAAYYENGDEKGTDYLLTIKTVVASEFQGRKIGALGIGMARKKEAVLKNVRRFLPGLEINCDGRPSGNVGPVECDGSVDPGWFQIGFDEKGNLLKIRFDAYHFT